MDIKFKNKNRQGKGFTIVELVIVIAVIGILSAILIPTFVGLVNKASVSADVMTVKNINTQLKISEETNGKPATFSQMLSAASEAGYDVNKLNPTTDGYSIVWDMSQNLLFLYDKDGNLAENQAETPSENKSDLWSMTTETPAENLAENSIAGNVYLNNNSVEPVTVSYGIEVSGDTDVNFTTTNSGTYNVVLNGGNLTVNAENATVNSYGAKNQVTVTAVDMNNSYHEFGSVSMPIQVEKGNVVLESTSSVSSVNITASNASNVTLHNETNTTIVVTATNKEVAENLNTIVVSGNTENIIVPTNSYGTQYFAGGDGSEESPYLISTDIHFYNIYTSKLYTSNHFKLVNDITVARKYYKDGFYYSSYSLSSSTFDGNNKTITVATDMTNLFYKIENSTLKNLNVNLTYSLTANLYGQTTFNNVDVFGKINVTGNEGAYIVYAWAGNYNFIDCKSYCVMQGNSYNAVFVGYNVPYNQPITINYNFENCTNEGSLVCDYAAMFIGNMPNPNSHAVINITNCSNNGLIQTTNTNKKYSHFVAYNPDYDVTIKMNNSTYVGEEALADKLTIPCNDNGQFIYGPKDESLAITINENGTFTVTPATIDGVAYYEISIGIYASSILSGSQRVYVYEKININQDGSLSDIVLKNYKFVDEIWVNANSNAIKSTINEGTKYEYTTYTLDGITYYYVGNAEESLATLNGEIKAGQLYTVYAYDSDGNLLASVSK